MVSKEDRKRKIINKRPLVLPDEVNGVTVRSIPNEPSSRRKLLMDELEKYIDKPLYCPALKEKIWVTKQTKHECRFRCTYDKKVTYLNLNLPLIVKHSSFLRYDEAKDNKQQKKMNLSGMIILCTPVKGIGFAKLSVGKTETNKHIQYSLTKITLEKLINEE